MGHAGPTDVLSFPIDAVVDGELVDGFAEAEITFSGTGPIGRSGYDPEDQPILLGDIVISVDTQHAPVTSANFLKYVDGGFYTGGRFHRATRPDNYTPVPPDRPATEIIQGGINPAFAAGEVMLIRDTINLSGENPLLGPNLDAFGPRFPALTDAWDPALRELARSAAMRARQTLHEGVYLMLSGPAYETRAELRMLRILGADAVGMSTVHEMIVARHAERRVLGFSLITNPATEDVETGPTHEEVMEMGKVGGARLLAILRELLPELV
jgi:hypothetical protein